MMPTAWIRRREGGRGEGQCVSKVGGVLGVKGLSWTLCSSSKALQRCQKPGQGGRERER